MASIAIAVSARAFVVIDEKGKREAFLMTNHRMLFLQGCSLLLLAAATTTTTVSAVAPPKRFTAAFMSPTPPTRRSWRRLRGGSTFLEETVNSTLNYNATSADPGALTLTRLWTTLRSSPDGLTTAEAQARLQQYGKNELESPPSKTTWELILEQFEDRLVQILLVVAVLSSVFSVMEVWEAASGPADQALWKSFVEPFVIVAILVLNAAVGVWQSKSAQGSLEALQKMQPTLATALRDGEWQSGIDASLLVPGDVLEIRVGDKVPADARVLELQSASLKTDEGSLTGESVTVGKLAGDEGMAEPSSPVQDQRGMLYSGTMVTSGSGKAVVVQTGMDTQFGKVRASCELFHVPFCVLSRDLHSS